MTPELLNTTQAAQITGLTPAHLRTLITKGTGPQATKIGSRWHISQRDLTQWHNNRTPNPQQLTIKEAAPIIGITPWTLADLLRKGQGPKATKANQTAPWLMTHTDIHAWIEQTLNQP